MARSNESQGKGAGDGSVVPPKGSPPHASEHLLRLPGYTITRLQETEHDYHIALETRSPNRRCPNDHTEHCVGYGRSELLIHDLPMHGKRVGLYIDARRFKCRDCGKTFMEPLPGVDGEHR